MNVRDLIEKLSKVDGNMEVTYSDCSYGDEEIKSVIIEKIGNAGNKHIKKPFISLTSAPWCSFGEEVL